MVVGRAERLDAVAVVGGPDAEPNLAGGEPVDAVEAKLGCLVQAQLRGIAFDINPADWTPIQSFLDTNQIRWQWLVNPQQDGTHPLTLEIRSFLLEDDGSYTPSGDLPPIELDIEVLIEDTVVGRSGRLFRDFWAHPFWAGLAGAAVLAAATRKIWPYRPEWVTESIESIRERLDELASKRKA